MMSSLPSKPTANDDTFRPWVAALRAAIAATKLESSPPERKTPTGTSPMRRRSTACMSVLRTAVTTSSEGSSPPVVAGRESRDLIAPLGRERLQLGCEQGRTVALRPVQGLDTERIAHGHEATVF